MYFVWFLMLLLKYYISCTLQHIENKSKSVLQLLIVLKIKRKSISYIIIECIFNMVLIVYTCYKNSKN